MLTCVKMSVSITMVLLGPKRNKLECNGMYVEQKLMWKGEALISTLAFVFHRVITSTIHTILSHVEAAGMTRSVTLTT